MKSSYENSKKKLIAVCTYKGYTIENPTWEFNYYAVVVDQDGEMLDVFDGRVYQMYKRGEILEIGDIRGRASVFNTELQKYMEREGNGLQHVIDYLELSELYVPYGSFPYSQGIASENGHLKYQKNLVLSYMRKVNNKK